MDTDRVAEQIAVIRRRFSKKLRRALREIDAALPGVPGEGSVAVDSVAAIYRTLHDMCGVGPIVGFIETGRVARSVSAVLIGPFRDKRGLTKDEVTTITEGLGALRSAAALDIASWRTTGQGHLSRSWWRACRRLLDLPTDFSFPPR
jgi:hypothetical protein